MSFGLQFTNGSGVVTLDTEFSRLSVLCAGTYSANTDSGRSTTVSFPVTITSEEPPLVFIRPTTVGAQAGYCLASIIGTPGNWTGFYAHAYSSATAAPNGKYFAAAFKASATSTFGLRLWDGTAKLLFDSGTASAVFSRAVQNWSFVRSVPSGGSTYFNYYTASYDFPEDEYLMLNSFSMGMVAGSSAGRSLYVLWDFPNRILYAITSSSSNPTAFYLPALFAKLTV